MEPLDSTDDEFSFSDTEAETVKMVPMTLWVPVEHKAKYDLIQHKSKRKFSKHLVKILKSTIDKVRIDTEAC